MITSSQSLRKITSSEPLRRITESKPLCRILPQILCLWLLHQIFFLGLLHQSHFPGLLHEGLCLRLLHQVLKLFTMDCWGMRHKQNMILRLKNYFRRKTRRQFQMFLCLSIFQRKAGEMLPGNLCVVCQLIKTLF